MKKYISDNDKIDKIYIIGAHGCGKSTLSSVISKILKIDPISLDEDNDKPSIVKYGVVQRILRRNTWVVDGAWTEHAKKLYEGSDLLIYMQVPEVKLYFRVMKRCLLGLFTRNSNSENLAMFSSIWKYFHCKECDLTKSSHKKYMKIAKKVMIVKNNTDVASLIKIIR